MRRRKASAITPALPRSILRKPAETTETEAEKRRSKMRLGPNTQVFRMDRPAIAAY